MTADLDTRARAAAAGLHRAADDLEPPEWEPPSNRRRTGARLAVAAVAVAGIVAVVVVGRAVVTDDPRQPVASGSGGVPALIPDALPDGLAAAGAVDLPRPEEELGPERMTVRLFGDATGGALSVTVFHSEAAEPADFGESTTVRGKPAWVSEDDAGQTALMWQEAPGILALVTSGSLDLAAMSSVAEGLTFGTDPAGGDVTVTVLPPGFAPMGALHDAALTGAILPSALPVTTGGHLAGFRDATGNRALVVGTITPEPDEVPVLRWMLGADAGEITVRGHQALRTTQAGGIDAVIWEESPGLYAVVGGTVGADAVLAAAESLRPATEQEWAAIVALGDEVSPTDHP
jgi:hypothetical protein